MPKKTIHVHIHNDSYGAMPETAQSAPKDVPSVDDLSQGEMEIEYRILCRVAANRKKQRRKELEQQLEALSRDDFDYLYGDEQTRYMAIEELLDANKARQIMTDAGWDESKHKRDHGKFSSTGGGAKTGVAAQAKKTREPGDPKFHEANYHAASAANKEAVKAAKPYSGDSNHPLVLRNHNLAAAAAAHAAAARSAHRGNTEAAKRHHEQALQHEAYAAANAQRAANSKK